MHIGRLKQCKLPANSGHSTQTHPTIIIKIKLKVHISRLNNSIQHHSAHSRIVASRLNDGEGAIVFTPPRFDLTDERVHGPREDVGSALDEKDLLRIADWVEELVDMAVCDSLTEVIATVETRGGGEGALLSSRYFESGVWIRPAAEGACGCAVACWVGKDGHRLASGVHCIEASVGAGGESVGEEPRC